MNLIFKECKMTFTSIPSAVCCSLNIIQWTRWLRYHNYIVFVPNELLAAKEREMGCLFIFSSFIGIFVSYEKKKKKKKNFFFFFLEFIDSWTYQVIKVDMNPNTFIYFASDPMHSWINKLKKIYMCNLFNENTMCKHYSFTFFLKKNIDN